MAIRSLLRYEDMMEMWEGENYSFSTPTPFTDTFYTNPENSESDEFVQLGDPAENRPTPLNVRGGEAHILEKAGAYQRRGILIHIFNQITFGKELLDAWTEPNSRTLDEKGAMEVGRQLRHFKQRQRITKELALSKIMVESELIFDPRTMIIKETADSDDITLDFGVAASHQGDAGGLRQGGLNDPDWDIQAFFDRIDNAQLVANKPPITDVWINPVNRHLLLKNTTYQLWAAKNGQSSDRALRGEVVEGVFGKNWHFVMGGYQDSAGTNRHYLPADRMLLTAPLNTGWYHASKGAVMVPTSLGLHSDVEAALRAQAKVYGEHAFAAVEQKGGRLRINGYAGDVFGLNFPEPDGIYQITIPPASSSSSG